MFHFKQEVDWNIFFRFDKRWIEGMSWARISPAARAVLPVIACHTNQKGEAFPGEETVAALSGRTAKIARQGIRDLKGFHGFTISPYPTKRGKRGKKFQIDLPPKGQTGRSFFFYRGIIDSGLWSELKPTAQSLYPTMRYFARYEEEFEFEETLEDDVSDFKERFNNRTYEICKAEIGQLAKFAGIDRRRVGDVISNLEKNFLVESFENDEYRVYLKPPKVWQAGYLNEKLKSELS